MRINNHYKTISFVLVFLSVLSFFIGFIYGENSAGAGTFNGDFVGLWKNLQAFLNNDLKTAIKFTTEIDHENYQSSRTPLSYILHKLFNPFVDNQISFIRSVFVISLLGPFLFYLCLREKFKNEEKLLLILISSIIFLSPYFRTSAFWGLEENYGILCLLASFLFLSKLLSKNEESRNYYYLFLVTLFSSLSLYFDQKLALIPLICFIQIIFSQKSSKIKIFCTMFYFIFSLPYIYLIFSWGNLIPTSDATSRGIGQQLHFGHIGYAATIIAFYLFPFLLYRKDNLIDLLKSFFKLKKNYYLIFLFFIYLIYLIFYYDHSSEALLGKGFIHKTALILFDLDILQRIFIYFSFFISWIIILIFVENNIRDKGIIFYFFFLSVIIFPILQEYFDPLIILMGFTFFNSKLVINYKYSIIFFLYLSTFLIFSNIYYYNLLN